MYLDNLKTASDVDGQFLTFGTNQMEGVDRKLDWHQQRCNFLHEWYYSYSQKNSCLMRVLRCNEYNQNLEEEFYFIDDVW